MIHLSVDERADGPIRRVDLLQDPWHHLIASSSSSSWSSERACWSTSAVLNLGWSHNYYSLAHSYYSLFHSRFLLAHSYYSLFHSSLSLVHSRYAFVHSRYSLVHSRCSLVQSCYSPVQWHYSLVCLIHGKCANQLILFIFQAIVGRKNEFIYVHLVQLVQCMYLLVHIGYIVQIMRLLVNLDLLIQLGHPRSRCGLAQPVNLSVCLQQPFLNEEEKNELVGH